MTKATLKIKKGDEVLIRVGKHKGETAKVTAVDISKRRVQLDGKHVQKKHRKPTQLSPTGGVEKRHAFIDISNVSIVHPSKKKAGSRIGYEMKKDNKVRVYRQAENKEIK